MRVYAIGCLIDNTYMEFVSKRIYKNKDTAFKEMKKLQREYEDKTLDVFSNEGFWYKEERED